MSELFITTEKNANLQCSRIRVTEGSLDIVDRSATFCIELIGDSGLIIDRRICSLKRDALLKWLSEVDASEKVLAYLITQDATKDVTPTAEAVKEPKP